MKNIKRVTFVEHGLSTELYSTIIDNDFDCEDSNVYTNTNSFDVMLLEEDVEPYTKLYNEKLRLSWTKNQDREEQFGNMDKIKEIIREMDRMEDAAKRELQITAEVQKTASQTSKCSSIDEAIKVKYNISIEDANIEKQEEKEMDGYEL